MDNPLIRIKDYGQSIWMDFISRGTVKSGELKRLILEDGICGVTSNPDIFEKAIVNSHDYDEAIHGLIQQDKTREEIYDDLTIEDIQMTADVFRPTYDQTNHSDGYVSLEVSPRLAYDAKETIIQARRLWKEVNRPNVMIKVPGIKEGIPAIHKLISEGININITLLFSLDLYREVTEAYISGLEYRIKRNKPVGQIASVASFFLSRIDTLVDQKLQETIKLNPDLAPLAKSLLGQTAIACAKVAYKIYKETFYSARFREIEKNWGHKQRLLWASTSTKDPSYSDIKYVEALIGPETVNTLPLKTIEAYRDHGNPANRLEEATDEAENVLMRLQEAGISMKEVTDQLEKEAVEKFVAPYDKLLSSLEGKIKDLQEHNF